MNLFGKAGYGTLTDKLQPKETAMIRQSQNTTNVDVWKRPTLLKYMGVVLLVGAFLMLVAGAYTAESNKLKAGLFWLVLGVLLLPDILKKSWFSMTIAVLALFGAGYALFT